MKALLFACMSALAAAPSDAADTVTIAAGVNLIPGTFVPGRQPDGNSVVFRTAEGLVVFDTGRHTEHTQKILDYAKDAGLPIKAVINSHWHLDHVGGNPRIREAYPDVRVYASMAIAGAMGGFLANYRKQLVEAIAQTKGEKTAQSYRDEIAIIDAGHALYPDEVVAKSGTRRIAGRDFELHLQARAVTEGDVWLYDPATRTLVAGDLVTLPVPLFDTACPARWQSALADLDRVQFKTLVPGHGAPMQRTQFAVYRHAYANLLACAATDKDKNACIDGWLADAKPLLADADTAFVRMLAGYYIDNSLRAPKAKIDQLCNADTGQTKH
ncbi:MBL fold metallo-hydrolase [Rudaea sp.]|uniref:MBL fold metallo-hydrolase n=1 Tax=Rudaea sp. TaxID=2136325 RepID=UPI002ED64DBF